MRILAAIIATASAVAAVAAAEPSSVIVDGSSTVYPITVAMAERAAHDHPELRIEVAVSGSSAGLRRLIAREIPIADASRCVDAHERAQLAARGIEYLELPIGFDGISVAVSARNTWASSLTVDELKRLWAPGSAVRTWSDLRAEWPAKPIALYAPGRDSGTFDYFTTEIIGTPRAMRDDATTSQNAMDLVQGVVGDPYAIGYFGYSYVVENRSMLKPLAIDAGAGPIEPTRDNILSGAYRLARPLFIDVDRAALDGRPEVRGFVEYYLDHARETVESLGGVPLTEALSAAVRARYDARRVGSLFADAPHGARLDQLLLGAAATPSTAAGADRSHAAVAAPAVASATAPAKPTVSTAPRGDAAVAPPRSRDGAPRLATAASAERLDALRDQALTVARVALDDDATVEDLVRAERDLRARLDEAAGGAAVAVGTH